MLIRSFREGDFNLYSQALSELSPYFFTSYIVNYARWIPIHLQNMICLEEKYPDLAKEFHPGNFGVRKLRKEFLGMAIDQPHELQNAVV